MNNTFGIKIKELRETNQMTQTEFAEKINVSKSVVSAYEKGIRQPSYKVLKEICATFNVPETHFFIGENQDSSIFIDITDLTPIQQKIIYSLLSEFKEKNNVDKK